MVVLSDKENETPKYYDDDYTSVKFIRDVNKVGATVKKMDGLPDWFIENKVVYTERKINEKNQPVYIKE